MSDHDPVLQDLEARAEDLRAKLAGEKPFAIPTDDFRRKVLKIGLAATRDAIETRKQDLEART